MGFHIGILNIVHFFDIFLLPIKNSGSHFNRWNTCIELCVDAGTLVREVIYIIVSV